MAPRRLHQHVEGRRGAGRARVRKQRQEPWSGAGPPAPQRRRRPRREILAVDAVAEAVDTRASTGDGFLVGPDAVVETGQGGVDWSLTAHWP